MSCSVQMQVIAESSDSSTTSIRTPDNQYCIDKYNNVMVYDDAFGYSCSLISCKREKDKTLIRFKRTIHKPEINFKFEEGSFELDSNLSDLILTYIDWTQYILENKVHKLPWIFDKISSYINWKVFLSQSEKYKLDQGLARYAVGSYAPVWTIFGLDHYKDWHCGVNIEFFTHFEVSYDFISQHQEWFMPKQFHDIILSGCISLVDIKFIERYSKDFDVEIKDLITSYADAANYNISIPIARKYWKYIPHYWIQYIKKGFKEEEFHNILEKTEYFNSMPSRFSSIGCNVYMTKKGLIRFGNKFNRHCWIKWALYNPHIQHFTEQDWSDIKEYVPRVVEYKETALRYSSETELSSRRIIIPTIND